MRGRVATVHPLTDDQRRLVLENLDWSKGMAIHACRHTPWLIEEMTAVAALALCDAASGFRNRGEAEFRTYAYRGIHGAITDAQRNEWMHGLHVSQADAGARFPDYESLTVESKAEWPTVHETVSFNERLDHLADGMRPTMAKVCRMIFADQLKPRVVASRLSLSKDYVKQLIRNARVILREKFAGERSD